MLKKIIIGIIVGSIVLLSSAGAIYAYQGSENIGMNSKLSINTEELDFNEGSRYENYRDARYADGNKDGLCDNCEQTNCQNSSICGENNATCSQNKENYTYQYRNKNCYSIRNENQNSFFGNLDEKNKVSNRNCFNDRIQNSKNK
ncbi:MAG: hypothetical protein WC549_02560 [Actinomycetota bacterium]